MIIDFIQHTIHLLTQQSAHLRAHPEDFLGLIIYDNSNITNNIRTAELRGKWDSIGISDFMTTAFIQRYDLAVLVITASEPSHLTEAGSQTNAIEQPIAIQRCRDIFAEHTLIFAPPDHDYIAFGFSKVSHEKIALDEKILLTGWQFNLFDYKHLPDWFNSRFWANPENWNKFRW